MSDYCEHAMIDLETLGTYAPCPVLSIGVVAFNEHGPQRSIYTTFNLTQQTDELGLTPDRDTVAWWNRQSPEAQRVLEDARSTMRPVIQDLVLVNQFLSNFGAPSKKLCVWGNGADFDNPILLALYRAVGLKPAWGAYNNRCYRTLKSLLPSIKLIRSGTHHNALDDATSQALHAVKLLTHLDLWGKF